MPVDLHRGDRRPRLGQGQGQRAEPGADLHHLGPGAHAGQSGDPADGVAVGHEVLAQGPAGPEVVLGQQGLDVPPAMGHRAVLTGVTRSVCHQLSPAP